MSKKTDAFYFDTFTECASLSWEAAIALEDILRNFDPSQIDQEMQRLHEIEHRADGKKHVLLSELVKAFITPIERDDIINLSQTMDDVTDAVEDIIIHMDVTGISSIRPDAIEFAAHLTKCCECLKDIMVEFANFKKSKNLHDIVIAMNGLEEEGDRMYIAAMKKLHTECSDPLEIIAWRDIYTFFENVCDACEDVADIVETIVIGNT